MSNTNAFMNITKEMAREVVDSSEPVSEGHWRWGRTNDYVIEIGEKFYRFTVRFHIEDGLQEEDVCGHEVVFVERTIMDWERV